MGYTSLIWLFADFQYVTRCVPVDQFSNLISYTQNWVEEYVLKIKDGWAGTADAMPVARA